MESGARPESLRLRQVYRNPPGLFARELPSTNDILKKLVLAEEPEPFTSLLCGRQTRGRGRPGNTWSSAHGDLAMSLWLPSGEDEGPLPLSLFVAGACLEALSDVPGVRWKYPNDLCRELSKVPGGDEAASVGKLGGILVEPLRREGSIRGHVAGIGINLTADRPSVSLAEGALPMATLFPFFLTPLSLSRRIVLALRALLVRGEGALRESLDRHLLWRGRWVAYTIETGEKGSSGLLLGRIEGLSEAGHLQVRAPDGELRLLPPHVRTLRPVEKSGGGDG